MRYHCTGTFGENRHKQNWKLILVRPLSWKYVALCKDTALGGPSEGEGSEKTGCCRVQSGTDIWQIIDSGQIVAKCTSAVKFWLRWHRALKSLIFMFLNMPQLHLKLIVDWKKLTFWDNYFGKISFLKNLLLFSLHKTDFGIALATPGLLMTRWPKD